MGDITKYLEGQYDGIGLQRSVQQMGDLVRAYEISQSVEETQLQAWGEEECRIASIYGVSETDRYGVGNLMKAYAEEDKYNEYLVDGAVLTCDQATLEPFALPDGENVVLEEAPGISEEERCQSVLEVWENPMSVNGKTYATVKDTIKNVNVMPFRCNCKQEVNRNEEAERIKADPECAKYGVCRHLMQLNEKWDNMPRETGYMKLKDGFPYASGGIARVLGSQDSNIWQTEEEGITMTSVLFCKHGGLIRAVTSGQEEVIVEKEMVVDTSDPQAVKEYMWKFFCNAGFSEVAVAGILANVSVESRFDLAIISRAGYYGLFQQGGDRKEALVAAGREWAEQEGLPEEEWDDGWKNLQFQCEYALQEYYYPKGSGWLTRGIDLQIEGTHIKVVGTKENFETAEDPSFAALLWAASFERCFDGDPYQEDGITYFIRLQGQDERYERARIIYEEFCGSDTNE